jgi:hypothetical protein
MSDRPPTRGSDRVRACAGSVSVSAVDNHASTVLREQCRDSRPDAP